MYTCLSFFVFDKSNMIARYKLHTNNRIHIPTNFINNMFQILRAKLSLPPYLTNEARALLKKVMFVNGKIFI